MRLMAIRGVSRRRGDTTTRPDDRAGRHPDRVDRRFTADRPNALWVTDLERHEALFDRAEVERLRGRPVAAGR